MLNQPTELVPTQRGLPAIINGSRRVDATVFKNSKIEAPHAEPGRDHVEID
jgi:hypothetical protein